MNFNLLSNNNLLAINQHYNNLSNINPLNKLFCSLMSDLPNEMDFGLRVATILTNSEKIDNLADFKFIDVIIECCILYICSCDRSDYSKSSDYPFEEDELIKLLNREDLRNLRNKQKDKQEDKQDDKQKDERQGEQEDERQDNQQDKQEDRRHDEQEDKQHDEQRANQQDSQQNKETILDEQNENVCTMSTSRSVSTKFNVNNVRKFVPFKDCSCFIKFWSQMIRDQGLMKSIFDLSDDELDKLDEEYVCQQQQQKNYYKIKRIVCLLKNISYSIEKLRQEQQTYELEEYEQLFYGRTDNASINLLRFFILLLNSDDQFLVNIALEIISNISPLVNSSLPPLDQNTYVRLLTCVYEWCVDKVLNSFDVNCLNRCLEILTKLINASHLSINRLIISEVLNQLAFFNRLTELLTCQHDVGVVVSTLECCLTLSENYPKLLLNENKHLIKILINLINCEEGKFFTLSSIRKVRIIDERATEYHPYLAIQQHPQFHPQQQQPQTILIQQPINQVNQKAIQMNDLNNSAILADNEQHVKNWYYANFEPRPMNTTTSSKAKLKLNEMYSDYVKHSCLNGRRNVVTGTTFSNLLKKYFPSISINQNEVDGLIVKSSINRINNTISIVQPTTNLQIVNNTTTTVTGNLTSPILKAHLSTPPKSTATTTTNSSNQIGNPSIINSNQSQQLINGPVTTTTSTASPLIKNLLANKLRNNQTTASTSTDDSKSVNLLPQTCIVQHQPNSTSNIIFTTNHPTTTTANILQNGTSGPNLITVPLQQHLVPVSSNGNMIFNTNQLTNTTGTMVVQPTTVGGQQQFLLVRTILPQQNNTNLVGSTTANQQPMRLILPSVITTSQPSQTITINGTPNTTQAIITQPPNLMNNIDKQPSNEIKQPNEKDKLLKACLGSNTSSTPPTNTTNNSTEQQSIKPISNSVKSSPLLNVLLDKGKLPEFSTVSNDTNAQETNKQQQQQQAVSVITTATNSQTQPINQLTNHTIAHSSTSALTTTTTTIASTSSTTTQFITSTVNSNPTKMYILTTKSPLTIQKNSNNIQTTSNSTPIQSFIIQQPNTTMTAGQPQYILQQSPSIVSSNLVSQPLNVQQPASAVNLAIQNASIPISNPQAVKSPNSLTNNVSNEESTKNVSNSESTQPNTDKQPNELTNCVLKTENGEINEDESKKLNPIKKPIEESKERPPVLTNGCLEKENLEQEMETDSSINEIKNSLLKRQLESDDSLCKRAKTDSQATIIPVVQQTAASLTVKQEPMTVINNTTKPNETQITIAVSLNGILPTQPTISNTIIKTALNSPIPLSKTNTPTSTTCTIEKIKIAKPNVIIQNSTTDKQPQIVSTNSTASFKVVTAPIPAPITVTATKIEYVCEWSNCRK